MRRRDDEQPDESALHCAACGCRLAPTHHATGPVMYWTLVRGGALVHVCAACHTPGDGGVQVVAPRSLDDRWMPLLHEGA